MLNLERYNQFCLGRLDEPYVNNTIFLFLDVCDCDDSDLGSISNGEVGGHSTGSANSDQPTVTTNTGPLVTATTFV